MNKHSMRELYTDLRAAVLIGVSDSIYTVLDRIRGATEEEIKASDLYTLGGLLEPLELVEVRSLAEDADPAIRMMAAVALAKKYLRGEDVVPDDLDLLASDSSSEVRANLVQALSEQPGSRTQEEIFARSQAWLTATPLEKNQQLVEAGLRLLPAARPDPEKLVELLLPLQAAPDQDFRAALVEVLAQLAVESATPVLNVLQTWAEQPEPNVWLLTQSLSASWSFAHSLRATQILEILMNQVGDLRAIRRAIARHADQPKDSAV